MINGLIVYERGADGVLSGEWTQTSDQKRTDILLGSERAVPQASHAAFEGSYDVTICDTSGAVIYKGTLRLDLVAMSIVADWIPDEKWKDRGAFQGIGIADDKRRLGHQAIEWVNPAMETRKRPATTHPPFPRSHSLRCR